MVTAIKVEDMSKHYRLGVIGGTTLRDDFNNWWTRLRRKNKSDRVSAAESPDSIWALKNINIEIATGEIVGIIGPNGAGKSTLLKILSRITAPTSGTAKLRGRVGSLLEVGTGFHPELTGRENIFLNGVILGMSRAEVSLKLDDIVSFADVEHFLDTPVKRYSSGMLVRLAFAVAAHLEPEILIVDEVLAVGDAEFQRKCIGKIKEVAGHGRTVLFVSHNLSTVSQLCSRGILIDGGEVSLDGPIEPVVSGYEKSYLQNQFYGASTTQDNPIQLIEVKPIYPDQDTKCISPGQSCTITIDGVAHQPVDRVNFGLGIYTEDGHRLSLIESSHSTQHFNFKAGKFTIRVTLGDISLSNGRYRLNIAVKQGKNLLQGYSNIAFIQIRNPDFILPESPEYGPMIISNKWGME